MIGTWISQPSMKPPSNMLLPKSLTSVQHHQNSTELCSAMDANSYSILGLGQQGFLVRRLGKTHQNWQIALRLVTTKFQIFPFSLQNGNNYNIKIVDCFLLLTDMCGPQSIFHQLPPSSSKRSHQLIKFKVTLHLVLELRKCFISL